MQKSAEIEKRKCSKCGCIRLESEFGIRKYDIAYKTCQFCRKKLECEHKKRKSRCKECGGSSICEHDRERSQCKDCGGSSICEHQKRKSRCKVCDGNEFCEHNMRKSNCKDCRGGSICKHNKNRTICKDCRGGSICKHDRVRSKCKECGGGSICEHNRERSFCKDCGGKSICEHNRIKFVCKDCKGKSICEHNKIKTVCKDCGGGAICEHGGVRSRCKDCGGGSFCEHNVRRSRCRKCGGGGICEHDKIRSSCIKCNPKYACQYCHHVYVNPNYRFHPYCFRCYCVLNPDEDIPRRYKLKEHHLRDALKDHFPNVDLIFDQKIDNACSRRRPDVRIECLTHTVIIECDEDQHKGYNCENKRTMEIFQDLGNRPLVLVRFNPDSYLDEKGHRRASCFSLTKANSLSINKAEWRNRIKKITEIIDKHIKQIPEKEVTEEQLFYNYVET